MWLSVFYGFLLVFLAQIVVGQQDASKENDTNHAPESNAGEDPLSVDYSDENEIFVNAPQSEAKRSELIEKRVQFEDRFNQTSIFLEFGDKSEKLVVSNCSLMLVNGTELSLLNVTRDWNAARFEAIGLLDDIGDEAIVDVQFITKNQFTLLLVALDRRYQVYVFNNGINNGLLKPIEQIAQIGQHQRSILFSQGETVYALIGNGVPNELGAASTIRIYKWRQSHFTKVSQHSIHWMSDIHLCQADVGMTVFVVVQTNWAEDVPVGSPDDTMTLLEVFVFVQERWRHVQNLHISSTRLYTFHMAGKCFLITAPVQRNGTTTEKYVWEMDGFRTVPQHQAVAFNYFVSTNNELALILNRNKLTAFPDADFKRGFSYEQNVFGEANGMFLVDTNDQLTVGFVRVDRNITAQSYHIDLMGVNVDVTAGDVGAAAPGTWSSEDCFKDLGVAVVNRRAIIEQIGLATQDVMQKEPPANHTVTFNTEFASMTSGVFSKIVTNVTSVTVTPVKLLKQIKDLKARIDAIKASRPKREVPSPTKLHTAVVNRLYLINNKTNHIFKNLLLRSKQMNISAPIHVKLLKTNSIRVIDPTDGSLSAPLEDPRSLETTTLKHVNRLVVRTINGIDWNQFTQSIYLKNAPKTIKGNVIVTQSAITRNLTTSSINGLPVDTFLTLQTDQTIDATIMFRNFLTLNITANFTNGIRFPEDVVLVNGDKYIETPVAIHKCTINKLTLADSDERTVARHVIGTQLEDLSQIYTGKVVIRGSLRLENVFLEQTDIVSVDGRTFELNVPSQYWMKSVDQSFASVRFVGVTQAPQIISDLINSSPLTDYLLCSLPPLQKFNLVMHSAVVHGHIFTDPAFKTTLVTISENCILRQNTAVIRGGRKSFTGNLTVNDFSSMVGPSDYSELNRMQRDQLLTNRDKVVFSCIKQFQQLKVIGQIQVTSEMLKVSHLNGFDLIAAMQNMARVNEAASLDEVVFESNVQTASLQVELIDETPFAQVLERLEAVVGDEGSIGSVRIAGDVTFAGSLSVRALNSIELDAYLALVVSRETPAGTRVAGTKRFLGDVNVGQLDVQRVNEWNLAELIENALHKNKTQTITGKWQIGKLQIRQLIAPTINGVSTDQLIDSSLQDIEIESDLMFKTLEVNGKVTSSQSNCDLANAMKTIQTGFRKTQWKFIEIDGQTTWPTSDLTTPINHMFSFAVTNSVNQIITGEVTFGAAVEVHSMTSSSTINGVDLTQLSKDALVANSVQFQSISGEKTFRHALVTGPILAHADLAIPIINNCNIIAMNQSLFRSTIDRVITGVKHFRVSPSIYHLQTDGAAINGVLASDIVTVSTHHTAVPSVQCFNDIYVESNLVITDKLNGMPFETFLEKRLRQYGEFQEVHGRLTFEHLVIRGNASRLVTISEIPIDDIVLQRSEEDQMITGRKRMLGTLSLDGPVAVSIVNGYDLVSTFLNTVWLDDNLTLPHLTVYNNITLEKGMIVDEALNGADVMSVMYWQPPSVDDIRPIQREITKEIQRADMILHQSQSNTSNVYLDYAADVKIKYVNQSMAETFIVDTFIGCEQCQQCPAQNFVSITKYQVNIFRCAPFEKMIRLNGISGNFTVKTVFEDSSTCPTTAYGLDPYTVLEWNGLSLDISKTNGIRDAKLFQQDQTTLLLIHEVNKAVNVLQLNAVTNTWMQLPPLADGQAVNKLHVLTWEQNNIVLTMSTTPGSVHGLAQMYAFDGTAFTPLYDHIPGDFDQCAWLHQKRRRQFMVWFGRSGSDVVTVFKAVHQNGLVQNFEMLQTIVVQNAMVRTFVAMPIQDSNYMAVVTQNSFLYLYRYNYLEGWIRATFGYFKDIEIVVPFRYYQRDYLYVSMKTTATALVVHQRG